MQLQSMDAQQRLPGAGMQRTFAVTTQQPYLKRSRSLIQLLRQSELPEHLQRASVQQRHHSVHQREVMPEMERHYISEGIQPQSMDAQQQLPGAGMQRTF